MKKPFRKLSAILLILAVAGMAVLLVFDALNRLSLTAFHQRVGALSFMLIGGSYICLQLSTIQAWKERLKRLLLGLGFFLWGCEQFLSPGPLATLTDSLVVIIFVSDLSLVIAQSLKHPEDRAPGNISSQPAAGRDAAGPLINDSAAPNDFEEAN